MNAPNLQTIKSNTDILEVAARYCDLKKVNDNTYKAVVNPIREEKTSSLHFYIDSQKYHDFGSNESGDVLDLISKVENISLSDAINRLGDQTLTARPIKERPQPVQAVGVSSEQLLKEFSSFEELNTSNTEHLEELLSAFPEYLLSTENKSNVEIFLTYARYDNKNKTLVMAWFNSRPTSFNIATYKRRRLNGAKWVNRKGTHPNNTVFSRIHKGGKKIYIVEGARDALTSILLGLNFIAIPTTSFNNTEAIQALISQDDEVIFICEDMQGYKAMKSLSERLHAKKASLKTFITSKDQKIDLSDFVMSCNSIKGAKDAISA